MPVIQAVLNGCCFSCLVDTGSERTLVCPRVVGGKRLKAGRPLLTADGSASHVEGTCRVIVGLQGHCFSVSAPVMSELGNLGVDCLIGGDAIDHMRGVTVKRGSDSQYSVVWGKQSSNGCCDFPRQRVASPGLACGAATAVNVSRSSNLGSLRVEDPDFVANFDNGRWAISWWWTGESSSKLQTRVSEYRCTQAPQIHERYCAELESWISKGWLK